MLVVPRSCVCLFKVNNYLFPKCASQSITELNNDLEFMNYFYRRKSVYYLSIQNDENKIKSNQQNLKEIKSRCG